MPRPKRTKVASSAPAPRKVSQSQPAESKAAPQLPKKAFDDLYDVSDPDDRVPSAPRYVENHNGKGKEPSSVSRGRVQAGLSRNTGEQADESAQTGPEGMEEPAAILGDEDIDLDSSSPAVEVGRRDQRTPRIDSSMIGNFRRRPRQSSILGRGPGRARSSSVESDLAEDSGLTGIGRTNMSAMGSNFKRRPRQSSITARSPAPVAQSSMGLEMERGTPAHVGSALKIGQFKRRAREPSILGTAQKKRQEQPLNYDDDEDDFSPEDESTPLNLSKTRNMNSSSAASSSNSRKRKLSAIQVPQSSPINAPPAPVAQSESIQDDEVIPATAPLSDEEDEGTPEVQEDEEEDEADPDLDLPLPSIEARSETPELMSETMAPPQSSSPTPSSPEMPIQPLRGNTRGRRPLRGRTPPPRTQDSPISSPPSLTHSPNRPSTATTRPRPPPKRQAPPRSSLSTAALQAFLPRRRRRAARDPFDIASDDEVDTSGLAPSDDELSHLEPRARHRRPTTALHRTPAPLKGARKAKEAAKSQATSTAAKPKRTYCKARATSDKENSVEVTLGDEDVDPNDSLGPLPDVEADGIGSPENSQELEKRVGKELKAAAKKFKEVDQWEMEFEDVTASSSSPRDAR